MDSVLSIMLILGSVITFLFVMRFIRKSTVRIEDTFFWIIFCVILVVLSIFPRSIYRLAIDVLGFQSPINFIYLVIIFVLIINQFLMSLKVSRLTIKQKELVQALAITAKVTDDNSKEKTNGKNNS